MHPFEQSNFSSWPCSILNNLPMTEWISLQKSKEQTVPKDLEKDKSLHNCTAKKLSTFWHNGLVGHLLKWDICHPKPKTLSKVSTFSNFESTYLRPCCRKSCDSWTWRRKNQSLFDLSCPQPIKANCVIVAMDEWLLVSLQPLQILSFDRSNFCLVGSKPGLTTKSGWLYPLVTYYHRCGRSAWLKIHWLSTGFEAISCKFVGWGPWQSHHSLTLSLQRILKSSLISHSLHYMRAEWRQWKTSKKKQMSVLPDITLEGWPLSRFKAHRPRTWRYFWLHWDLCKVKHWAWQSVFSAKAHLHCFIKAVVFGLRHMDENFCSLFSMHISALSCRAKATSDDDTWGLTFLISI